VAIEFRRGRWDGGLLICSRQLASVPVVAACREEQQGRGWLWAHGKQEGGILVARGLGWRQLCLWMCRRRKRFCFCFCSSWCSSWRRPAQREARHTSIGERMRRWCRRKGRRGLGTGARNSSRRTACDGASRKKARGERNRGTQGGGYAGVHAKMVRDNRDSRGGGIGG
jgi:hypothetical protein